MLSWFWFCRRNNNHFNILCSRPAHETFFFPKVFYVPPTTKSLLSCNDLLVYIRHLRRRRKVGDFKSFLNLFYFILFYFILFFILLSSVLSIAVDRPKSRREVNFTTSVLSVNCVSTFRASLIEVRCRVGKILSFSFIMKICSIPCEATETS